MDFQPWLQRIRNEPEWVILGALLVILLVGGGALYYSQMQQSSRQAQEEFGNAFSRYLQATRSGDYQPAVSQLSRVAGMYPQSDVADLAVFFLGKSYYRQREWVRAQQQFNRLLSEYPTSSFTSAARLHLAYSFQQQGKFQQAVSELKKLTDGPSDDPVWVEAMWQLAMIQHHQERTDAARTTLRELRKRAPEGSDYWTERADMFLSSL